MTEVTITSGSIKLHSAGDQKKVIMDITNVINAYTLTVPHITAAEDFVFTPTMEADCGITVSGHTLTFVTSTTIAGRIVICGR